ncbi:hypothetical protein [Thermomonospora amylolytica]|uniref:hypothetical protein n=1 Tax=Thermomonospora amylolytica TaxID=1411117 RepID=UPI000E6C1E69|nr:hypothetical protein [Thermomonospora amylolytica]
MGSVTQRGAKAWAAIVIGLIIGVPLLVLGIIDARAGLRVERGQGVPGTFVAAESSCNRAAVCHWTGAWIPADGTRARYTQVIGYDEDDLAPGRTVSAIDPGDVGSFVYRPGTSEQWLTIVPLLLCSSLFTFGGLYGLWVQCRELRSSFRGRRLTKAGVLPAGPPDAGPERTPVSNGRPGDRWVYAAGLVTAGLLVAAGVRRVRRRSRAGGA